MSQRSEVDPEGRRGFFRAIGKAITGSHERPTRGPEPSEPSAASDPTAAATEAERTPRRKNVPPSAVPSVRSRAHSEG